MRSAILGLGLAFASTTAFAFTSQDSGAFSGQGHWYSADDRAGPYEIRMVIEERMPGTFDVHNIYIFGDHATQNSLTVVMNDNGRDFDVYLGRVWSGNGYCAMRGDPRNGRKICHLDVDSRSGHGEETLEFGGVNGRVNRVGSRWQGSTAHRTLTWDERMTTATTPPPPPNPEPLPVPGFGP